jgi:hypothetical protein
MESSAWGKRTPSSDLWYRSVNMVVTSWAAGGDPATTAAGYEAVCTFCGARVMVSAVTGRFDLLAVADHGHR